jgi:ubiquinone/menaquinone biosynthesis C-methylase UbiE
MGTPDTAERCASTFSRHLRPGMALLDAGCGPGTITVGLAELVAPGPVTAVDLNPEDVRRAGAALWDAGFRNARIVAGDVRALPFDDASFDAVHAHATLDSVADPDALREYLRVLRPGGVIGIEAVAFKPSKGTS